MSEEKLCRIALNTFSQVGSATFHRLMAAFGAASEVFRAGVEDLSRVEGVSERTAEIISKTDPVSTGGREVELAGKSDARIVTLQDDGYPAPLLNAYAPPPVLSIKGEWKKEDEASIAIVGSRSPTRYGRMITEKFSRELAEMGVTVVSGLARGVDGAAHRAAMAAGGRTVAVLGCGLNVYYPAEHRELQKKIPSHGAVISQFSFTARPDKLNFPMRNRVISGLALGVLVTEAAARSGALITAYAALDDNRDVFAVPGQINSPKSDGANALIKKGHAKLAQNVDDIIEELPDYAKKFIMEKQASLPFAGEEPITDEEAKALEAVGPQPKHIDAVAGELGLPTNMVSAILLALELKGRVKQMPGKLFIRE